MKDFYEGLGTVYERMMLNDILDRLISEHKINSVLEVPIYGITGVPGINSIEAVRNGCKLTLIDNNLERIREIRRLWESLGFINKVNFLLVKNYSSLPFKDHSFDLVWNFAALWHVREAPKLVAEMARVSSKLVFIVVQNKQLGYYLRKYVFDKALFKEVYEEWLDLRRIKKMLEKNKVKIVETGYFDVPPFPDLAMPVQDLLKKLGFKREEGEIPHKKRRHWNIIEYYKGHDPELKEKIQRFTFIEKSTTFQVLKSALAHLAYIVGEVRDE